MNKKGFSLVEIIISIGIVLVVGTISIVSFNLVNNKSNKELERVTNEILEAATLYIKTETDENGQIFLNKVLTDAKGVKIPLNKLVKKGYVKQEKIDIIYTEKGMPTESNDYYVITFIENTSDYCDTGSYVTISSWMNEDKEIYLCDNKSAGEPNNSLYGAIINQQYTTYCYDYESEEPLLCLIQDQNITGIEEPIYYYRGKNVNNYIQFKNNNKLFRIIRTVEDKNVKIVADQRLSNVVGYRDSVSGRISDNSSKGTRFTGYTEDGKVNLQLGWGSYGSCESEESLKNKPWNDSNKYNFICSDGSSFSYELPKYIYIYKYLEKAYYDEDNPDNYKSILDNYIVTNYKWCDNYNYVVPNSYQNTPLMFYLKCESDIVESNIALLTFSEYALSSTIKTINPNHYDTYHTLFEYDIGTNGCSQSEITMDLRSASSLYDNGYYCGWGHPDDGEPQYLRPAFVIKGTSKIIDGTGSASDPFIIDGFIL